MQEAAVRSLAAARGDAIDIVLSDWDLSGAREDLKVFLAVGYRVAQASRFPEWKPGNAFRATREAMLKR